MTLIVFMAITSTSFAYALAYKSTTERPGGFYVGVAAFSTLVTLSIIARHAIEVTA